MKMEISTSIPWLLSVLTFASLGATASAWVLIRLFGGQSSAFRHFLWFMALSVCLLAMPLAWKHPRIILPVLHVPMPEAKAKAVEHTSSKELLPLTQQDFPAAKSVPTNEPKPEAARSLGEKSSSLIQVNLWWAMWISGAIFCFVPVLRSHLRVLRSVAQSGQAAPAELMLRLNDAQRFFGYARRTRLVVASRAGIPFSYGILRPTIVLPQTWDQWDEQRIDLCLTHELAHIVRGDLGAILVAQLASALCWFNPLVWIAARKLRDEAENATDDLVLSRAVSPEVYAANLVSIAEEYQAVSLLFATALPMAQPNRLKQRIEAILNSNLSRKGLGFGAKLALGVVALTMLLATLSVELSAATSAAVDTFKEFLAKREAAFSKLSSFQMEGTLTITCSDAYLKLQNSGEALEFRKRQGAEDPGKETRFRYRIWGKGKRIKEIIERIDENGQLLHTDTYYLSSRAITWVQQSPGKQAHASSAPLSRGPNYGLINDCPAFLEYSFLHGKNNEYPGIHALLPSHLSSASKWDKAIQSLLPEGRQEGGVTQVTISGTAGSCRVDLRGASGMNQQPQIKSVTFLEGDQSIAQKVDVLDYFHDSTLGDVGKRYRMGVAYGPSENVPGVIWEFKINQLQTNCSIPDSTLVFEGDTGLKEGDDPAWDEHVRQADVILEELRALHSTIHQWAIKYKKKAGDRPTPSELLEFVQKDTPLYTALSDPSGPKDLLGNPLGPLVVDTIPKVDPQTRKALSDAVSDAFWPPFRAKETVSIAHYQAKAVVCFQSGPEKVTPEQSGEQTKELNLLKANLPKDQPAEITPIPNTTAFEVAASGATREEAAKRANGIAVSLLKSINVPDRTTPPLVMRNQALPSEAVSVSK